MMLLNDGLGAFKEHTPISQFNQVSGVHSRFETYCFSCFFNSGMANDPHFGTSKPMKKLWPPEIDDNTPPSGAPRRRSTRTAATSSPRFSTAATRPRSVRVAEADSEAAASMAWPRPWARGSWRKRGKKGIPRNVQMRATCEGVAGQKQTILRNYQCPACESIQPHLRACSITCASFVTKGKICWMLSEPQATAVTQGGPLSTLLLWAIGRHKPQAKGASTMALVEHVGYQDAKNSKRKHTLSSEPASDPKNLPHGEMSVSFFERTIFWWFERETNGTPLKERRPSKQKKMPSGHRPGQSQRGLGRGSHWRGSFGSVARAA